MNTGQAIRFEQCVTIGTPGKRRCGAREIPPHVSCCEPIALARPTAAQNSTAHTQHNTHIYTHTYAHRHTQTRLPTEASAKTVFRSTEITQLAAGHYYHLVFRAAIIAPIQQIFDLVAEFFFPQLKQQQTTNTITVSGRRPKNVLNNQTQAGPVQNS